MTRLVALLAAVMVAAAACSDDGPTDGEPRAIPTGCGLPTPDTSIDESVVPAGWVTEGAVLTSASRGKGRLVFGLNVPFSVEEVLRRYRAIVLDLGFEVVSIDNEVFEAEVYFERDKRVGAIQIRRSACDDASAAFVSLVNIKSLENPPVPPPTPSGT